MQCVLVVEHRANFASVSIYRRVKPRVLPKNAATHSLVADLHDVDLSSRDSSVVRLTGASRWGERRAVPSGQSVSLETVPILTRCHAGALAKGSREIRLRRKVQCDSNIEQRLIPSSQKHLRVLKTVPAHVLMRRFTHGGFERSRKVEPAQGGNFREPGNREIPPFQICVDVFPHPGQPASVESAVRELREIFVGGETAMTMR